MAGPAPKPKAQRARANIPDRGEWEGLPAEPFTGDRPDLPRLPNNAKWREETQAAWENWWGSPMAHKWDQGDWPGLIRLAILTNDMYRGRLKSTQTGELRQLETMFGLNPEGRKKLRWLLPDEASAHPGLAVVTPIASRKRDDPRKKK